MRLIKILIVDDEYLERTLIKMGIDWKANGFEIIEEANSGEEALKIIKEVKPAIVFTDICMPFMDGLELCRNIKEKYSDIKIVIITGHRDFEYAQRAIGYGVNDFILKPINHDKILKICLNLKAEINEKQSFLDEFNKMKDTLVGLDLVKSTVKVSKTNEIVESAKLLIEENISSCELSLKNIAARLYVNSSYLSRIFKHETGENFVDYIMKLRITKSIEYLKGTNLKAYEIGEKVGISDAHYFSICFKKYIGKSINEYKKGL
ncbi:MAG: response regulator [Clostridiaceae bacterium]|nr:response regulator [Clostridiaceae bacterium]